VSERKMKRIMIICLVLALVAATVYFLMAAGVISVPTLNSTDKRPQLFIPPPDVMLSAVS